MAYVLTDESNYEDIADAIREMNGTSDTYTPSQMAGAIRSIRAGVTGVKGNAESSYRTGDVNLTQFIASGRITIKRSTGDIRFDMCDAAELEVETDTGSIRGSLLTEKVFIAKSDTGRVSVPETTSGGVCKLTTDTGDIKIEIP